MVIQSERDDLHAHARHQHVPRTAHVPDRVPFFFFLGRLAGREDPGGVAGCGAVGEGPDGSERDEVVGTDGTVDAATPVSGYPARPRESRGGLTCR